MNASNPPERAVSFCVALRETGRTEQTRSVQANPQTLSVRTAWARKVGEPIDVDVSAPGVGTLTLHTRVLEVGPGLVRLELRDLHPETARRWSDLVAPFDDDDDDLPEIDPEDVIDITPEAPGEGVPTADLGRRRPREETAPAMEVSVRPVVPDRVLVGAKSAAPRPRRPIAVRRRRPAIERNGSGRPDR